MEELKMVNDLSIPLGIQEAIVKNKLVLFIGSGMSQQLGFPSWRKLTVNILNQLSRENIKYNILKESLEAGFETDLEALGKVYEHRLQVLEILDKTFSVNYEALDLTLHKKLGQISSKIITTNYDKVIEYANPGFKKIRHNDEYSLSKLPDTNGFIFKLHGCIDSPETCILFKQEYSELYNNKPSIALEELKKIISDHTIIFLGFSLEDDYVLKQFNYISNIYKGLKGKHYFITTKDRNISDSDISSIKINNWTEIGIFLDKILEYKKQNQFISSELTNKKIIEINKPKIALLVFNSLDKPTEYSFEKLIKPFKKFNAEIYCNYLSDKILNDIEGYDYLFVFTKTRSQKIYIEDRYLKSKLVLLKEFEAELLQQTFKTVIFFTDDINVLMDNTKLPIILKKYSKDTYESFIFKIFRKGNFDTEEIITGNSVKINIELFSAGTATIKYDKTKISKGIDPINFMDFIGRTSDLESIVRKIIEVDSRVIIVKGSGGIGKTTTVKKAAYELAKRNFFTEGVSFISCDMIEDYITLENRISECFDLDHSINFREHILQENVKKDLLIMLDNFETLIYLTDFSRIIDLISFICSYCTLILTSRELLNVDFEEPYLLRQLTTDEAIELFGKNYDITRLSEAEYKILRFEIIENMLSNNPLAIKIITNNLPKGKNIISLKEELELNFFDITITNFNELFYRDSDVNIEKIKSLYNSINYSYSKINQKEKIAFDSLALFPDGIELQNFKLYLNITSHKNQYMQINDKDLKSLENKSLIEINGGIVNLQSIMYRFATFQFDLRPKKEQDILLRNCFYFVNYINENVTENNNNNNNNDYFMYNVFDNNRNNFLKVIDNIERIDVDKSELLWFVLSSSSLFSNTYQSDLIIPKLVRLKSFFTDVEDSQLFFDVIIQQCKYFNGSFDEAFQAIKDLVPLELLNNIDFGVNKYMGNIINIALKIYSYEGYDFEILSLLINKKHIVDYKHLFMYFFHLGMYKEIKNLVQNGNLKDNFFFDEWKLNEGKLSIDEIDTVIKNTFEKKHLNLLNNYYIKSKIENINKRQINKLVSTNPYTLGLKYLMLAFVEKDNIKVSVLYEKSIENLKHIKYYHVEAIYFYAKYLKSIGDINYSYWLLNGKTLAQKYRYAFHNHRFRCLESGVTDEFDVNEDSELINPEFENYITAVNNYSRSQLEHSNKMVMDRN